MLHHGYQPLTEFAHGRDVHPAEQAQHRDRVLTVFDDFQPHASSLSETRGCARLKPKTYARKPILGWWRFFFTIDADPGVTRSLGSHQVYPRRGRIKPPRCMHRLPRDRRCHSRTLFSGERLPDILLEE